MPSPALEHSRQEQAGKLDRPSQIERDERFDLVTREKLTRKNRLDTLLKAIVGNICIRNAPGDKANDSLPH